MSVTAAQLEARLDALKKALANGAKSVSYDGRMVTFRDVAEIKAAIALIEQDLAAVNGTNIVRRFKFTSDKDL